MCSRGNSLTILFVIFIYFNFIYMYRCVTYGESKPLCCIRNPFSNRKSFVDVSYIILLYSGSSGYRSIYDNLIYHFSWVSLKLYNSGQSCLICCYTDLPRRHHRTIERQFVLIDVVSYSRLAVYLSTYSHLIRKCNQWNWFELWDLHE